MNALLRAELMKLRTTRTFVGLTGVAVGTSLLIAVLVSILSEPTQDSVLSDVYAADTSSFAIVILAVIGISGEWRHRTITSSLLAAPQRIRLLAAKAIAYAAAGVLVSLAISVAVAIVGTAILSARDLPLPPIGDVFGQWGRNVVVAALLGAFGVGIGGLVRNQIAAVVGLLALSFVIEPMVLGLAPDYGRFGPLNALPVAVAGLPEETTGFDVDLPSVPLALVAMAAWIGGALAIAGTLFVRRDLE